MVKINGNEIRPGNILEHNDGLWIVVKISHVKPGKGGAFAQVELKNLRNGSKLNERFRSVDKVEKVRLEQKEQQFLYESDNSLFFMDQKTFDQIDLPIELESDDFNISDAVFIHNQEGNIVGSRRNIHGFKYKGVEVNTFKHFYNTNWGLKENDLYSAIPNTSEYPSLVTKVTYTRNVAASILNIFLPIILIMILVILNPFIEIADSQIQLPASLLLVLTFARSGYREMLPDSLSYTTYADMFFLMCLGVTLIIFLYAIFVANKYNRSSNKAVTILKEVNIYVSKLSITFVVVVPFIIWSILPN